MEVRCPPKTIGYFHYVLSMAMTNMKLIGESMTKLCIAVAWCQCNRLRCPLARLTWVIALTESSGPSSISAMPTVFHHVVNFMRTVEHGEGTRLFLGPTFEQRLSKTFTYRSPIVIQTL